MIELAAFLGNPGKEYSRNRHNAGFMLAEKLPIYGSLSWQKKFRGLYAAINRDRIEGYFPRETMQGCGIFQADEDISPLPDRLHFIKPETFMNLSGESVHAASSFFKIKCASILVIHDELELPLGTLSLKFSGGLGGHNGLRSMKTSFGSADFWRLRIGIGRPDKRLPGEGGPAGSGEGIIDWVLSNFSAAEAEILDKVLETAADLFMRTLSCDPQNLLKEWRKKKLM